MDQKELVAAIAQAFPVVSGLSYGGIFVVLTIMGILAFFGPYLARKAENTASKEDVKKLTILVEAVKADMQKDWMVAETKFRLKHDALLSSLSVLDAYFSSVLYTPGQPNAAKQYSTIVEVRECHSKLLLTCDSAELVATYMDIIFPEENDHAPLTIKLNKYRRLVRKELGFGDGFAFSEDKAFVSTICFEKT